MAILDTGIRPQGDRRCPDAVVGVDFRQFCCLADAFHHVVELVDTERSCIVPNFIIVVPLRLRILKKYIVFRIQFRYAKLHSFVTVVFFSGFVHPCQFFIAWDITHTSWVIFSISDALRVAKRDDRGLVCSHFSFFGG